MPLMKAVRCTQYGEPEVLQLTQLPIPTPKSNEVRIRIRATTVSVADFRVRSFTVPPAFWLPARLALGILRPKNSVLGVELAGDIDAMGSEVKNFELGEVVYAATLLSMGAYAQFICLPDTAAIQRKPESLSYEEAAAIPIGACTALHFLQKANIKRNQQVLIYGSSGSVGTYAVQLARYFGAEVTAVCSQKNFALVRSLGAHHVLDYTDPNFDNQLGQYDLIFVAVDKISFKRCNRALKEDGVYVNVTVPVKSIAQLWTGLTTKKKIYGGQKKPDTAEDLKFLNNLIDTGDLKVVVDRNYKLEQIVEAHRYVEQGHKTGNVTVTVE